MLEELDSGHETLSLQAILVQVAGMRIGSCDQRYATPEQAVEQTGEDHGVADIADKELIEAKDGGVLRYIGRNFVERIFCVSDSRQSRVHLAHHAVKVNALLVSNIQGVEEEIQQEGLATPDAAP
jgi:hypothetical protein